MFHVDERPALPTAAFVPLSLPHGWSRFFLLVSKMLRADSAVVIMPLALLLGCVFYILYGLLLNYNAARKTGLPLVILPIDCANPLWLIFDRRVAQWARHIPFGSGTFSRFNWRGWEIWDRYRAHEELGDGIMFVTPGKNYLQLCDAEAVSEIFRRRGDFPRPPESTGNNSTLVCKAFLQALIRVC